MGNAQNDHTDRSLHSDQRVRHTIQTGQVDQLATVLTTHRHLMDAPNPLDNAKTPMHYAAEYGQVEMIEVLVRLGSKAIDHPNSNGATPMHSAAVSPGSARVVETLVRLGSTAIDTPDGSGRTPMCHAAGEGRPDMIKTLVRLGSRAVDIPDNDGRTPLHHAAWSGREYCIEELLRLGSRALEARDGQGLRPIDLALRVGAERYYEAGRLLKELGADLTGLPETTPKFHIDFLSNILFSTEENFIGTRFRVYFARSLLERLFVALPL